MLFVVIGFSTSSHAIHALPNAYRSCYTGVTQPGNFRSSSTDVSSIWSFSSVIIKRIDDVALDTGANSLLSVMKQGQFTDSTL
jgi:hypothetical protein